MVWTGGVLMHPHRSHFGSSMSQSLTAKDLQAKYGQLLQQPPFSDCGTAYLLHEALTKRKPPIAVKYSAVRIWWDKHRVSGGQKSVQNAKELEEKYGDILRPLAVENNTAYKLCDALKKRDPPLYVSDGVARQWLQKYYGPLQNVDNAGHLETLYGERIRAHTSALDAASLSQWLMTQHQVSVPARICQHWLSMDWSSSGALMTPEAVEQELGIRLRLNEYRHQFADDASAKQLSEVLSEGQPSVRVSPLLLRQWYTKFHPDSGPTKYETGDALEEGMGEHMRSVYPGFLRKLLRHALSMRRKAVLVSERVCRTWIERYAQKASTSSASSSVLKRPAGAQVSTSVWKRPAGAQVSTVLKRPASAAGLPMPVSKRTAASSSSSSGIERVKLEGVTELETACGQRYRQEVSDLGLGLQWSDMQERLRTWGYDGSEWSCKQWLQLYRVSGIN